MEDAASKLRSIQRAEAEDYLRLWREAVAKLRKARIREPEQLRMLEGTASRKSMKAVADRTATILATKRKELKMLLSNSERDAKKLLKLLQPAPAQFHRIAILASAVVRGRERHNEQLQRLVVALGMGAMTMREAATTVETIDGDQRTVRPPIAWEAGAIAEEFEKRAHVLPKETAVLIALFHHLGRWPIDERDARTALEHLVLGDSLDQTFDRLRQAQGRVRSMQVFHGKIVDGVFVPNTSST